MTDYKKIELLVKVAKLYYESDFSQDMIAKKLGLSRPYISKLLKESKDQGIVHIQVIDPLSTETPLEQRLRERFSLERVRIVPMSEGPASLPRLGLEAARFLDTIIQDSDIIGLSWGATIHACSQALLQRSDLNNITSVQLCGGISNLNKSVYATEIANNFAATLGSTSYSLPLPAVMDSKQMKDIVQKDHNVAKVLQYGYDSNIALFTTGVFGQKSALVQAGYISHEEMKTLTERGAVGDICSHLIDIYGNLCDPELDQRTIAIPLDEIKKKKYRICVAQGLSKVDSMLGALNGGFVNVLITNEETAVWILKQDDYMNP